MVVSNIFYFHHFLGKLNPFSLIFFVDGLVQPPMRQIRETSLFVDSGLCCGLMFFFIQGVVRSDTPRLRLEEGDGRVCGVFFFLGGVLVRLRLVCWFGLLVSVFLNNPSQQPRPTTKPMLIWKC